MISWLFGVSSDKERIKQHEKMEIERLQLEHQKFLICKQIHTSKIKLKKTGLVIEELPTPEHVRKYNKKYKSNPIDIPKKSRIYYEDSEKISPEY